MSDQRAAEPTMQPTPAGNQIVASRTQRTSILDDPRVLGWGSIGLVLILWELIAILTNVNQLYLPRPTQIVIALFDMFANGGMAGELAGKAWRRVGGVLVRLG